MKQNSQFTTADADELTGAEITFKNGNVVTASDSEKQQDRQRSSLIHLEI